MPSVLLTPHQHPLFLAVGTNKFYLETLVSVKKQSQENEEQGNGCLIPIGKKKKNSLQGKKYNYQADRAIGIRK